MPMHTKLSEEVQMGEELTNECMEVNAELCSLDDELFGGGWSRVKLTRSQKRMQRRPLHMMYHLQHI